MADASPVLIWILDTNGVPSYYNKTFRDFIGVSKDEDISSWKKIVHPDDFQYRMDTINTALAKRSTYALEFRLLRADGQWRWMLTQGNPRVGSDNEFFGFVVSSVDITDRKEAETKIKESEKKFEAAILAVEGIIWTNNANGEMFGEQPGWANLTGQRFEEYQGFGWAKAVHPDDAQPTLEAWNKAVENRSIFEFEHRVKTRNEGTKLFSVKAVPVFNQNGTIQQWVGVHTDISVQREAAEKIKESEKQLRELSTILEQKVQQRTTQLEEKNTELKNINSELKAFTYVSSHDLQEPLRKIQTYAGRLLEKENQNLSDSGKNYFKLVRQSAERMQKLIQDLLAFSGISAAERKFEIIDLNIIIEEVKIEFEETIAEKHAVIEVGEVCEVKIIPFQFRQLLHNLIGNALKFSLPQTPPHIKITSRNIKYDQLKIKALAPLKEYCHITITDNGIGFEKEFSTKIFEVFQKLHGKDEFPGTGIGLAIVKKIVDNHNGIITATSELNKGATFDIYLPAGEAGLPAGRP